MYFSLERRSIRILLSVFAVLLVGGTLIYANYLANELAIKERHITEQYAKQIAVLTAPVFDDNEQAEVKAAKQAELLNLYQGLIVELVSDTTHEIPIIHSDDSQKIFMSLNVKIPPKLSREEEATFLKSQTADMKELPLTYDTYQKMRLYYGESFVLRQLRWFPVIQVLIAAVFIGLVLLAFQIAKKEEQNRIWAGLAKETAHQLGTPVSSLMAWIDVLRMEAEERGDDMETLDDMEHDVLRLQSIVERFSKIGSKPELKAVNLSELLEKSAGYMQKRMSKRVQVQIRNEISPESVVYLNPPLFEWVIENLVKNALDAMEGKEGRIDIHCHEKGHIFVIDVKDTGKGMPKNMFRKIFEPGFTTKKRGWGLGLSLSKRIMENYHKGSIYVKESEAGKGTTFRVELRK